ncbi:MAG: DUF6398 domain-containing protein [Bacteroidales bacterium]|jgi:hypothetical protein|nr:DUF6398 domain-containing protein [Bacteroidales bacterium]
MNKAGLKEIENRLIELTGAFCAQKLDDEYFQLSEKLIKKLGRKRNVPFESGKIEIWAASIIHALGLINFLFDKSAEPYVSVNEINEFYGTKQSTVTGKSKQIRDLLKLSHFDKDFSVRAMRNSNPMDKMVMVDGFIVPLDSIPEDLQEMVIQARKEGRNIEFTTQAE